MRLIIVLLYVNALLVLSSSCAVLRTPGLFSGYNKLEDKHKNKVKPFQEDSKKVINDGFVYFISGSQMKALLKDSPSALLYLWSPHCSSESCYLLSAVQEYCNKYEKELFIVTEYFDFEILEGQYTPDIKIPVFAADFKHYKTNYCDKYMRLFMEDILEDQHYEPKDLYKRYFFFNKGELIKTGLEL